MERDGYYTFSDIERRSQGETNPASDAMPSDLRPEATAAALKAAPAWLVCVRSGSNSAPAPRRGGRLRLAGGVTCSVGLRGHPVNDE